MKAFDWLFGHRRALDNILPPAQQVLVLARQEADRLYHSFVGTEHLLLGLLLASDGAAALKKTGIDPVRLKQVVESSLGPGVKVERAETLPCTPRVMQTLRMSAKEAHLFGHDFLTTEHLLLGLLRLRKGVAWRSLQQFPVRLDHARTEMRAHFTVSPEKPNKALEPTP